MLQGGAAPSPTRGQSRIDAEAGTLDHRTGRIEQTFRQELRKCQFEHGRADCGKEACTSDHIAAGDGEDVGRIEVVVLIPLVTVHDGDVPFEPPAKYVGAQPIHLLQKNLMLDKSVGRDRKNLHPYLRVNFVWRDQDHHKPRLAICRSAEADSRESGSRGGNRANMGVQNRPDSLQICSFPCIYLLG